MTRSSMLVVCLILTAAGATAQVYQSKDAEGNPVFSDRPSDGARAIEVPPTNSADSVEPREPSPAAPAARQAPAQPAAAQAATGRDEADDDYMYHGGADNEEARQRLKERREDAADRPDRDPPPQVQPLPSRSRSGVGGGRR
ncbi:MAG: DUF4124 domain-containing protein [Halioglobus sp.]|nr:DUF4124 domain-containing protein [Halioglobus sp.]